MGTRQRKGKAVGANGKGESSGGPKDLQQHLHRRGTASEDTGVSKGTPAAEDRMASRNIQSNSRKGLQNEKGQNTKDTFSKAAALAESDNDDSVNLLGSGGHTLNEAGDQERVRKERERRRTKKEDRSRNRDMHAKQKKAFKGSLFSEFFQGVSGRDIKSRVASWLVYIIVLSAIVGIFVLRALEEYYGMDGDVSGEQRLHYLSVLGLEDGASESDIRRSYRTLSVRWHPDRYPNCGANCQQRFQEIAAAYEYLMRKQRKSSVDDEAGERGESAEGEEYANVKVTSQGIVDFTNLGPNDVFPPTSDTKNVWSIMVHQDKDDWSQSVYEMWQESSRALGKYVKFGVISVRGRKGKDALKKLPINVKIFPAILLLTAGMHPEVRLATRTAFTRLFRIVAGSGVGGLAGTKDGKKVDDARTRTVIQCMCFFQQYPNISRPSVESLNRFIADAFPSSLDVVDSARLLKSWLSSSASSQPLAAQYKAVIIPSAASASKPSLLVKHAAFANKHLFNFCFLSNIRSILTSEKEELINVIENPPTWVRQLPPNSASAKALKLPVHREKLREQDLTSSSNILLFADEGRGISRIQSTLHTVRSKLLNPSTALALALDRFKESIQPFLFQQNSASLCKGSLQRRVFCLVAIEAEEGIAGGQSSQAPKTLDLARIKSLLNISKQKYLEDNPQKNLEKVWERAVQKAKEYEKTHFYRGASEEVESSMDTKEPDDLHIEQPDDIEEEIIHVQVVRLSVGKPTAVPSLPGLPKDTMFNRLRYEELDDSPVFLLDLEGSRIAPLPALFVGESGASADSAEGLYSRLYQTLDELQSSPDDDDEDSRISFSELPQYCAGQEFARRCLPSEQRPWWSFFQSGGWGIQIGLLITVGALVFFVWSRITAEKFLCGMLLFSLGVGAWSTVQPFIASMFGGK